MDEITVEMIMIIAPRAKKSLVESIVPFLNQYMPRYEVTTHLRVAHFIAQCAHESDSFKTMREYASGKAYEGRKDLGNVHKGDGVRFRGRGIIQLTGRYNYRQMGEKLDLELERNPQLAESPEIAVLTALEYWKSRNINHWADLNSVVQVTKKINGGTNGLRDRKFYLKRARLAIPLDFSLGTDLGV
jgi:putative chitinase